MKFAHLADIQVRAHSRHDEFRKSFQHLFESLRTECPDRIVLAGDIVHNKTNISPEQIHIVAQLFNSLSVIAPVDIILGNHDLAMKNMDRMDALTPIVFAMANSRVNFMRSSHLNNFATGFQYVVLCCSDDSEQWKTVIEQSKTYQDRVQIALWHGTLNGAKIDNNTTLESPYNLTMFDGLDYAMLGDIHKTQILGKNRRVAYPGSYPKQNFGESQTGGYFLWDIVSKTSHSLKFIELPTVCPYYTLDVPDVQNFKQATLKSKSRLRIRTPYPLNALERGKITQQANDFYSPVELTFISEKQNNAQGLVIQEDLTVENLRTESTQNSLLKKYFEAKGVAQDTLSQIYSINHQCPVANRDVIRNVRYKIESYTFGGMFSFGQGPDGGHEVNLARHRGLVGVFGRNAAGKSSLVVDVPLYCLFNKIAKPINKNQHYINDRSDNCFVKMKIRVNNDLYEICRDSQIKRTIKRRGGNEESSVTNVTFKNEHKCLDGIDRAETDRNIKSVFGTAEDFMMTSVAPQFDLLGFVGSKATERKKTIARYFDLEVFDEKHSQANETLKDLRYGLKRLAVSDFPAQIKEHEENNDRLHKDAENLEKQVAASRRLYEYAQKKLAALETGAEKQEARLKNESVAVKAMYNLTKNEVDKLVSELKEFDQYACMSNEDCCLGKREKVIRERLAAAQSSHQKERSQMLTFITELKALQANAGPHKAKLAEATELCSQHKKNEHALQRQQHSLLRELGLQEARLQQLKEQQQEFLNVQKKFVVQEMYVKAMGKDGLAFDIIKDNLSRINKQIETMLGADLNFQIWLEDDDKEIVVYLQHQNQKPRMIELASGMEKTVASIAIRAALIAVTPLPISNIFVLDESFTSLDTEHMASVRRILHGLTKIFDTIFLVCHSEQAKDFCDSFIIVEKDTDGFSQINT